MTDVLETSGLRANARVARVKGDDLLSSLLDQAANEIESLRQQVKDARNAGIDAAIALVRQRGKEVMGAIDPAITIKSLEALKNGRPCYPVYRNPPQPPTAEPAGVRFPAYVISNIKSYIRNKDKESLIRASELLDMLMANESLSGWLPIETAPKNGTHILVKNRLDDSVPPTTVHWFNEGWHLSVNQKGEFSEYIWGEPTHWFDLTMGSQAVTKQLVPSTRRSPDFVGAAGSSCSEVRDLTAPPISSSPAPIAEDRGRDEAFNEGIEAAKLVCETVEDEYMQAEQLKYPENCLLASNGARTCIHRIDELKRPNHGGKVYNATIEDALIGLGDDLENRRTNVPPVVDGWTPEMGTDKDGCYTREDGECISPGPCLHTPPQDQNKIYIANVHLIGKAGEARVRFVSRHHIKNKPTEANPSPIRVLLCNELERIGEGIAHVSSAPIAAPPEGK